MNSMSDIGRRLKQARKQAGLTQTQAIHAIYGVCYNRISYWERGKRVIDVLELQELANVYGVSSAWLLTGKGEMTNGV